MSQLVRSAKNLVKGYSSTEILVRDATANTTENPSPEMLDEIAERTYGDKAEFFEIMDMLDKRVNDKGKYWKHVAKALTVLDYLVRFGSGRCVKWCKQNLYVIKTLREFRYEDESGADQGQIIRVKARELTALLMDDERLKEERRLNKMGRRGQRPLENGDDLGDRDYDYQARGGTGTPQDDENDEDLQRALRESLKDEELRQRREAERQAQLELSKEEEELKRLQLLQQQQQQQAQLLQQQQQQPVYYDIFGNPITPEEYLQFQQQQQLAQQQQQALMSQQQYLLAQQQQQQAALLQQQQLQQSALAQQQLQQNSYTPNSNNPFSLQNIDSINNAIAANSLAKAQANDSTQAQLQQQQQQLQQQQPSQGSAIGVGNGAVSDKYSELNALLMNGPGIDTFGNTGSQRIPAQHTKTGTFINSQGTGYKQVTNASEKPNPFLGGQYTGLPSTNMVPNHTGYGFGNQGSSGGTLLDL